MRRTAPASLAIAAGLHAPQRLLVALTLPLSAGSAWASYGNMRLDGVAFALALTALYLWGTVVIAVLALGLARHRWLLATVTGLSLLLVVALVSVFHEGRAALGRRPLGGWAMFTVLLIGALPVLLATPWLQWARRARQAQPHLPVVLLALAWAVVPLGSLAHTWLQELRMEQVIAQARTVAPGRIGPHIDAARARAAASWVRPWHWHEHEELKGVILGFSHLPFIEQPAPLLIEDQQALARLVADAAPGRNAAYTGKLEARLRWDRLVAQAAADKASTAAALSPLQAQNFLEYFGLPHTNWLCPFLGDAETVLALGRMHTQAMEGSRRAFAAQVQAQCGIAIDLRPATDAARPALPAAAGGAAASLAHPAATPVAR